MYVDCGTYAINFFSRSWTIPGLDSSSMPKSGTEQVLEVGTFPVYRQLLAFFYDFSQSEPTHVSSGQLIKPIKNTTYNIDDYSATYEK